jgi:hypothetical protein
MRSYAYVLAAVIATTSAPAFAVQIAGLYNTGVDNNGNVLAAGVHDTHYVLNDGASKGGGPYVYENPNYAATRDDAAFIAAFADGGFRQNPATYALTFDLTGYDPATAFISGRFAADDVAEIFLNGVSTGLSTDTFYELTDFRVDTGFVAGLNTLTFKLTDTQGEPSALFVDRIEGAVEPAVAAVPEPASWAMMVGGFGLIGAATRRRQRTNIRFA